jgi:RNA polymerase sigma factor (sigma-70 family)
MGSFDFWARATQDDLLTEAQTAPSGGAMDELVRRFEPLTKKIARQLSSCPTMRDDLENEARLAVFLAVQRHRPGHPGFARYAEITMRGAALRWYQAWNKRNGADLEGVPEPAANEQPITDWGDGQLATIVSALPEGQQDLLDARYIKDFELTTIARLVGTSESAVSQRLRTAHKVVAAVLAA